MGAVIGSWEQPGASIWSSGGGGEGGGCRQGRRRGRHVLAGVAEWGCWRAGWGRGHRGASGTKIRHSLLGAQVEVWIWKTIS